MARKVILQSPNDVTSNQYSFSTGSCAVIFVVSIVLTNAFKNRPTNVGASQSCALN